MRNIFLALVLANLAFAAWHTWFSERPRPVRDDDADLPGITLVKELPADVADLKRAANGDEAGDEAGDGAGDGARGGAVAPTDENGASAPSAAREAAAPVVVATESASEPLTLTAAVAAASAARSEAAAPVSSANDAAQSAPRCTSVGPFRELAQAATAAANLRAAGYQPTQRVAEGEIWIGYWVYIEAIASETQANEILEKVRENGIADSYVIPNSDTGNLVSLGVFSEISGVATQRDKVRELGYEPKVVDRTRRATVYWVDVVLTGDQVLDFDSLQTPGRIIRLEQRACEAPAA